IGRCRDLLDQGYRPTVMSVTASSLPEGLVAASVWYRPAVSPAAKEKLISRKANAAVASLKLGQPEKVWPLLKQSPDPELRSVLIHRLALLRADPKLVRKRLDEEKERSLRMALLLSLGEFGTNDLPPAERETLLLYLLACYRNDSDPGIHGAVVWLLR